jgi:hypothetical protein
MKKKVLGLVLAVAIVCAVSSAGLADVVYGSNVDGLYKSFNILSGTVAGIAFDPTATTVDGLYDRVYFLNRVDTGTNTKEGLYAATISSETYSARLALAGLSSPYGTAVDASGNVYVCYTGTAAVYKITNPVSGSPTQTQMLKNYGFATSGSPSDDDPVSIGMVPNGFGGSYEAGQDLVLFDNGLDWDDREAVSVIDKTSLSTAMQYTNVWNDGDAAGAGNNDIRGATSEYDGYAYFARMALLSADDGSGNAKTYINRVNADGILQNIFIDVAGGTLLSTALDDSITVNPVDGSVWFVVADESTNRYIYRIDIANASLLSSNNYLATTTLEITFTADENMNVGINDMAISPDGKFLAVANPSGTDKLWVFNIVPEPTTLAIFTVAGLFASFRRRK